MPIRPELRVFYGREWREVVRPRILKRAGGKFEETGWYKGGAKCEQCRAPDQVSVHRGPEGMWRLLLVGARWHRNSGGITTFEPLWSLCHTVFIVLTVAHLDHVPGHDTDDNLKALCQWCHLNYDKLHHKETRQIHKDAARPILVELAHGEAA